jgi:UDP-N-acetylmuramyl pentapeptide phosphotransferase/UDP-N-acetylglucosamine-1-phosphate transferase
MRPFLLWLFSAIVAGLVGAQAVKFLVTSGPVRRRNYRGLELPATAGIGVIVGILAGLALTAVLHVLFGSSKMLSDASSAGLLFATAGGVFGFIGLWDDLAGTAGERGWRAHARAAVRGRATAGAIKLFGGAAAALIVASVLEHRFWWAVVDAVIIALSANAVNLLDKRPGRAGKAFVLVALGLLIVGGPTAPGLAAAIGAVLVALPFDLRERTMLGDAGANALGAVIGVATVLDSSHTFRLVALALLAIVTAAGARPGLSRVIDSVGPLRRLDAAGRV